VTLLISAPGPSKTEISVFQRNTLIKEFHLEVISECIAVAILDRLGLCFIVGFLAYS